MALVISLIKACVARLRCLTFCPQKDASAYANISPKAAYLRGSIRLGKNSQLEIEQDVFLYGQIDVGEDSRLVIKRGAVLRGLDLHIQGSTVEIGPGTRISGSIFVEGASQVLLGAQCILDGVSARIRNTSRLNMDAGAVMDGPKDHPFYLSVDKGCVHISEKAHLQGRYFVRLGGNLNIGLHAMIGFGTEVHCDKSICIGDYALISNDVMIFDTNSHSSNWEDRRRILERGYPVGALERNRLADEMADRPRTAPVVIGNDVWIGRGASITKGCRIGARSIIGLRTSAGGLDIPEDSVVVTAPPRVIINKQPLMR